MRRWSFILTLLAVLVGACARGEQGGSRNDATTSTTERAYSFRPWYDAAYVSPERIRITFDGPSGGACGEHDQGVIHEDRDEVRVEVRFYEPFVALSCALTPRSVVVSLAAPLGARRLRRVSDDTAFREEAGRLVLIPESTPCGRYDCSAASSSPASCAYDAYSKAVNDDVDGGLTPTDPRCDGSFLVMTIANNSACQPEQYGGDCTKNQNAYFVAKDGNWNVVTLGQGQTCEDVWRLTHIRFPPILCAPTAE
jgi:hypothetical protein